MPYIQNGIVNIISKKIDEWQCLLDPLLAVCAAPLATSSGEGGSVARLPFDVCTSRVYRRRDVIKWRQKIILPFNVNVQCWSRTPYWCSPRPRRSHTSTAMRVRSCVPSNPAARWGHPPRARPHVYVLAQGARRKSVDFFPQSLLYVFGDFHTFGPFPERIVLFQVSGTVYDA